MLKVGFIVEGGSEKIVIESDGFKTFLLKHGIELVTPVIDAKGGGNLLPKHIDVFTEQLAKLQAKKIFVLTDLEDEPSIEIVKSRIGNDEVDYIFVAVKALEAWFLADTDAINTWLKINDFYEHQPENTPEKPWQRLKDIAIERAKSGPGNKIAFAKRMTKHWGFSIEKAAQHNACPSAIELVDYISKASKK